MVRRIIIIALFMFALVTSIDAAKKKNVLVVCPYSISGTWAREMLDPIKDIDKNEVEMTYGVMRNTSFKNVAEMNKREQSMFRDLGDKRPDLILIFGPGNFILAEDFNSKWKDVPMILIGELNYVCSKEYVCDSVPRKEAQRIPMDVFAKGKNMTFVYTPVYVNETIDLMKNVLPNIRKVMFFGGEEFVSREIEMNTTFVVKDLDREFITLHPGDITFAQLVKKLPKENRKTTGFLFCNWHDKEGYRDKTIPNIGVRKALENIVPLFNTYNSTIDRETLTAGFVSYDKKQLVNVIKDMMQALFHESENPREIPFVTLDKQKPVLNYAELEKTGLDPQNIKGDIVFKNIPENFWNRYKVKMLFVTVLVMALVALFFYRLYKHQRNLVNTLLLTQKELRQAKDRAEMADKMKTAFVQNVSHEIRTPLNAVLGFSQLLSLSDDVITPEEKQQYVEYIEDNSDMLMMLINDILAVSDIERGEFPIQLGDVICNKTCKKAMRTVEGRVPAGVKLYFTTEVDDTFLLHTDEKRLRQVLINFLTNACKHTDKGEIHINCSVSEIPGKVTFSVTDTGDGVPPEKAEAIFERFTKLDSFKQGFGLGLNICRTIAQKLNGTVKLDTAYTGGARFLFVLPIDKA